VNGDGYADLLAGTSHFSFSVNAETEKLWLGGPTATRPRPTPQRLVDQRVGHQFGDVNADGFADVLVSATVGSVMSGFTSTIRLDYGSPSGPVPGWTLSGPLQPAGPSCFRLRPRARR
jgi:hypothetical protein